MLIVATIPILLHLLSKRKLPLIQFSSLEFLKKLQKKKARRVQLRQLILLAIRTLALIMLVLAFMRPALQANQKAGSAAAVEIVILFDDGLYSSVETRDGQMLRLTSQRLESIFDVVGPDDRVNFIRLSNPRQTLTVGASQLDLIRDKVDNLELSFKLADMDFAMKVADSILTETEKFNREIYLISGFHSSVWDSVKWHEPTETEDRILLPVGPEEMSNFSLGPVRIENSILQAGQPVTIFANIFNHSSKKVKDVLVSLYLDGERVAQSAVNIPADASQVIKFSTIPRKAGKISGYLICEDVDPFVADNRSWFVLNIPEKVKILAVTAKHGGYANFVNAGLAGVRTDFVEILSIDRNSWESKPLNGYDVVLFLGLEKISSGAAQRVSEFVNHGGGVIFFQDLYADLPSLSRELWRKLGFAGAKGVSKSNSIGWGKLDLTHPMFGGVFEDKAAPRSPLVHEFIEMAVRKDDQVIIPFSNGKPFLMERRFGSGNVLLYSISLDPASSNFIYSGIFAPILLRSIGYVISNSDDNQPSWETGVSHKIILPVSETDKLQMILPDLSITQIIPRPILGGSEIITSITHQPGIYTIDTGEQVIAKFPCNIPDISYDLARTDIKTLSDRLGVSMVIEPSKDDIQELILANRFGRELWRPIVIIFLLLLLAESLIGRSWRKSESIGTQSNSRVSNAI